MANINLGVKPKQYRFICLSKNYFEHVLYTPYRETGKTVGDLTANPRFQRPMPPRNIYIFDEEQAKRLPERHFRRID